LVLEKLLCEAGIEMAILHAAWTRVEGYTVRDYHARLIGEAYPKGWNVLGVWA
jgi:hypothetical protein